MYHRLWVAQRTGKKKWCEGKDVFKEKKMKKNALGMQLFIVRFSYMVSLRSVSAHSVWNDQYHAISSFSLPLTDCTLLKRRLFCYQCLTLVLFQTCMTFFHGKYEGCLFPYDCRKYWSFQTWKRTRIIKVVHISYTIFQVFEILTSFKYTCDQSWWNSNESTNKS